jgi:hypothetical protein
MQRLPCGRRTLSSADCWKSTSGLASLPSSPADAARSVAARPHLMAAGIGPDVRSRLSWRSPRHCRTIFRSSGISRRKAAGARLQSGCAITRVGSGISRQLAGQVMRPSAIRGCTASGNSSSPQQSLTSATINVRSTLDFHQPSRSTPVATDQKVTSCVPRCSTVSHAHPTAVRLRGGAPRVPWRL